MGKRLNPRFSNAIIYLVIPLIAVGFKAVLLLADAFPFNADEAVVALMAKHILEGEWPTFFYGQAYMGSLDAFFVALGMALLGKQVFVIRLVQVLLYTGTVVTTIYLGFMICRSRRAGWVAGLLIAIPPVNVTLYTTVSLGGYGEALLIGNLILILTLKIIDSIDSYHLYVLWGILVGLGFWTFGLTLVYSLPCGFFILWKVWNHLRKRDTFVRIVLSLLGASIGALPWVLWAASHGLGQLLGELTGSAIAGASSGSVFSILFDRLRNFTLLGISAIIGLRPPWEVRWLALPLLPFALTFWLVVTVNIITSVKEIQNRQTGKLLLLGVCIFFILGYFLTPFGADPSGRYFIPLAIPMSLFAAIFLIEWRPTIQNKWLVVIILGVLVFNLWGNLQSALRNPPGITTQFNAITWIDHHYDESLIDFLEQQGEFRGYTNYWVAYPLAFLSDERMIYTPKLPYHQDFRYTSRDNRYDRYNGLVAAAPSVAYITTNHDSLDQYLRDEFRAKDIRWREIRIGDYQIFYALEPIPYLEDLDADWLAE